MIFSNTTSTVTTREPRYRVMLRGQTVASNLTAQEAAKVVLTHPANTYKMVKRGRNFHFSTETAGFFVKEEL